jgi:threonine synthase
LECEYAGASVNLVNGLINHCAQMIAERKEAEGWFDVSTLKEPYRVEGKKTLGYELAEQLDWELPDAVIYPAGGGTGLVGMWKAFEEMETMGLIDGRRPRMIAVQAAGCAPIVRAFDAGAEEATEVVDAHNIAAGLRVPKAVGDRLMLKAIRQSGGTAIAIDDTALIEGVRLIASSEGIFAAPEGGACVAAIPELLRRGLVSATERVVLFNTGTGAKYIEALQ